VWKAAGTRDLRILVVGAGIAGLGLARALRARGLAPDVVERVPRRSDAGTGIYLLGNATRALGDLGLADQLRERAVVIPRQRFCDARGRVLAEVDLAQVWGAVGPCVALPWRDLHDLLSAGVPVRAGLTVAALRQEGARAAVELSDGTSAAYDLVVGADGIHSTVRRLAFDQAAVRPVGQVGWRFVADCPLDLDAWTVLLGHPLAFLAIPIGAGRVYCYADLTLPVGAPIPPPRLAERFAGFGEPVPTLLAALGDREVDHIGAIEEVVLDRWSRGSVLVIGDAAHATSPNMAQGAALALEDGLELAACLDALPTVRAALDTFEARRRPRTERVRVQTHRRDRTRALPPAVRDAALRLLGHRIYRANYGPLLRPAGLADDGNHPHSGGTP
jgi:FAD-dependent urate hydroxylase